jgi:uncharacterized UPF0160 family protein
MEGQMRKDPTVCVMSKRRFSTYKQGLIDRFGEEVALEATQLLCTVMQYDPEAKTYNKHRGEITARYRERVKAKSKPT